MGKQFFRKPILGRVLSEKKSIQKKTGLKVLGNEVTSMEGKKENKKSVPKKQRKKMETEDREEDLTNKIKVLNEEKDKDVECLLTLDEIKLIKCKDRTKEQTKRYYNLMYKNKLSKETLSQRAARMEKEKETKSNKRKDETFAQRSERNEKDRAAKEKKRLEETSSERSERNERIGEQKQKREWKKLHLKGLKGMKRIGKQKQKREWRKLPQKGQKEMKR